MQNVVTYNSANLYSTNTNLTVLQTHELNCFLIFLYKYAILVDCSSCSWVDLLKGYQSTSNYHNYHGIPSFNRSFCLGINLGFHVQICFQTNVQTSLIYGHPYIGKFHPCWWSILDLLLSMLASLSNSKIIT